MGLFDTIKVTNEVELPEFPGEPEEIGWQSKTVQSHPRMDTFKIEDDVLKRRHVEARERKGNDSGMPKYEVTDERWDDDEYHGEFTFYSSYPSNRFMPDDREAEWYEYKAKFTDGELENIERVERGHMR